MTTRRTGVVDSSCGGGNDRLGGLKLDVRVSMTMNEPPLVSFSPKNACGPKGDGVERSACADPCPQPLDFDGVPEGISCS
jgi:hypothetical protein